MSFVKIAALQYPISFLNSFEDWQKKTESWVKNSTIKGAQVILFPEYGSMELTSLLSEDERKNLKAQAHSLKPFLEKFILTFQTLSEKYNCSIIAPSIPVFHSEKWTTNRVYVFAPHKKMGYQDKFFMTRFEDEEWGVHPAEKTLKIFQTSNFKFSISTCFDIEFAWPTCVAAQAGVEVVFVPSCTETMKGANRVHIGARARALENQIYTVVSQTVGNADWSPAVDLNCGYAAVYATPDLGFSEDGVVAKGHANQEEILMADLDLKLINNVRQNGSVLNYKHHQKLLTELQNPFKIELIDLET